MTNHTSTSNWTVFRIFEGAYDKNWNSLAALIQESRFCGAWSEAY